MLGLLAINLNTNCNQYDNIEKIMCYKNLENYIKQSKLSKENIAKF